MDLPADWLRQAGVGSRLSQEKRDILKERILQARLERGWTQVHLGELAGAADYSVSRWERGRAAPSSLGVLGLALLFEKPPAWFFGVDLPGSDKHGAAVRSRIDALTGLIFAGASARRVSLEVLFGLSDGVDDPGLPAPDDYWAGAWSESESWEPGGFPVAAAAGAGAEVPEEILVGHVRLDPRWLRDHALNPDRCDLISVTGDSMYPTLPDGCAILVDRGSVELRDGGIFVLRTPDGLVVKRVRREDENGRWLLVIDNPDWDPVPLDADVPVVGEVRWAGGLI